MNNNIVRAGILALTGFAIYSVWRNREALFAKFEGESEEGDKLLAADTVPHDASHRRRNKLGRGLPDTKLEPKMGVSH